MVGTAETFEMANWLRVIGVVLAGMLIAIFLSYFFGEEDDKEVKE